jgi:hypothetical protein
MVSFSECRGFGNFFGGLGRLAARLPQWHSPNRYRPEKHYMRGPGPKNSGSKNSVPVNSVPENAGKAGGSNSNAA